MIEDGFNPANVLLYIGPGPDNAIGENLIKLPFLRAVRELYPDASIAWAHGSGDSQFEGILKPLAAGLIDEIIPEGEIGDLFDRKPDRRFDLVIDTQKRPQKSLRLRRFAAKRFISATWGYLFSDARPPSGSFASPLLSDKLLALAAAAAGRALAPPIHLIRVPGDVDARAAEILPEGPTYVGFAPGAGRQDTGKMWPLDNYLATAAAHAGRGRVPVFVIGPQEREWEEEIRRTLPDAIVPDLDGPLLTIGLAGRLAAALANCSGTGHMLAAGGAPMVSLYGPTDPRKFAPYTPRLTTIRAQDFGGDDITLIPTDVVIDALDDHLSTGSGHPAARKGESP